MKKLLIVFALLFAMPSFADDLSEYVELLKTDLKAHSRDIISKGMQTFTDEEAKRFWPIYESYMAERDEVSRSPGGRDQGLRRRLRQNDRRESARAVEPEVRANQAA